MTADQIHLLRKSFARVEPQANVAALVFYRRLFEINPALRPLFKTDIEIQGRKLMDMLGMALSLTEKPGALEKELLNAGARHVRYGTLDEHYPTVGQAMLDMLAEVLGEEFTPATRQAWTEFYVYASDTMKRGAAKVPAAKAVSASDRARTSTPA
jgi:hemoglobin-like flavoprotein